MLDMEVSHALLSDSMVIPPNLQPLVQRLASIEFLEKYHQAALIDRQVAPDHEDAIKAHKFLDEARELNELVNPPPPAAAEQAA